MNKIQKLKAKITQLKKQNEQFRLLTHELLEAFYRSVNKTSKSQKKSETSFDLAQITNQAPKCSFTFADLKDFFTPANQETTHA